MVLYGLGVENLDSKAWKIEFEISFDKVYKIDKIMPSFQKHKMFQKFVSL